MLHWPQYTSRASGETIDDGRPAEVERWIWSPTEGLLRIKRVPAPRKDGKGFTKKNVDVRIQQPIKDPEEIAKALGLGSAKDLMSYETLKKAIKKHYKPELYQKIIDSFAKNGVVTDIGIPDDIKVSPEAKELARMKELAGV